jgi:type IV secretory pathway TraG/TraD family ATPase VirD4
LQSLSQARARWGEEADSLLNNTQVKLFLGPIQDQSTGRYLGEVLDKRTGQSRSHTSRGWLEETSTTFQEVREPVASAQTLMRLRAGEAILLHGHDVPAVVRLPAPWQRRGWWWSR